jgi:hypothetical protein
MVSASDRRPLADLRGGEPSGQGRQDGAAGRREGAGAAEEALLVHPGLEVRPDALSRIAPAQPRELSSVGEVWIWAVWSDSRSPSSEQEWLTKRATRDEARRLGELAKEINALDRAAELRPALLRLAAEPNLDVLSAAESVASIPAERRGVVLERVAKSAAKAAGPLSLQAADRIVRGAEMADVRAPIDAMRALLYLLTHHEERPNEQEVVSWMLRLEEGGAGLSGLIGRLDALFQSATGRRPNSTRQSRLDRAAALRSRLQGGSPAAPKNVPDPKPRPSNERAAPVAAAPPMPAAESRPVTPAAARVAEGQPREDATTVVRPVADAVAAAPIAVPSASAPAKTKATIDAGPPSTQERAVEVSAGRAPGDTAAVAKTVSRLERELEMLRGEVATLKEQLQFVLERGLEGREEWTSAPVSLDELPRTAGPRGSFGLRLPERWPVYAAGALLVGAVGIFGWQALKSSPPEQAPPALTEPAGGEAAAPAPRALPERAAAKSAAGATDAPPQAAPSPAAPADPAPPQPGSEAAIGDEALADAPENPAMVAEPTDAPEGEGGSVEQPAPAEGAATEGAAAAPANAEQVAERFGLGLAATHRITSMTKIFGYKQKEPFRIEELPGGDAIIDQCIVALAPRETYPKKLYSGYRTISLSCAGELRAVCDYLGCEPQQSCVTAASWVKPCEE